MLGGVCQEELLPPDSKSVSSVGVSREGWTCAVVLSPYNRDTASSVPMMDLWQEREGGV